MGFDKAQREQVHVSGLVEGTFIPAAAKSKALMAGTPDSAEVLISEVLISVASQAGEALAPPNVNIPDGFGLLLLPTILGGPGKKLSVPDDVGLLLPTILGELGPKMDGDGLGFGLAGSKPNENEGLDESSNFGSDETGSPLTRLCTPAAAELGKTEVALDVMTKVGRELATIVRAFALISSSLTCLASTFFVCSCACVNPPGERAVGLKEKLKLAEGGSNLNSDFGRSGGEAGNAVGLDAGEDGMEVASAWKLNLNLLGSLGAELNLPRDAVGLRVLVGLVEVLEAFDPFSVIGMINSGCSLVSSLCSAESMSISSNTSIVISDSGVAI